MVAIPLASVVDVGAENDPLPLLLLQVTICPAVATALPLASANCALIVTPLPAVGDELDVVAKYWLAVPAVPVAEIVNGEPFNPAEVAVKVFAPAIAPKVQAGLVAMPVLSVVTAPVEAKEPDPLATAKVTDTPLTALP